MEFIKTVISTLDFVIIVLFFFTGRESKDKSTLMGCGTMIALQIANIFLMWGQMNDLV